MTECIHGLDEELCDICSPRQTAVQEPPARPATRSTASTGGRLSTPRRPATRATASRPAPAETLPDVRLATLRAHHWTHVDNVSAILRDAQIRAGARPELDVSSPSRREARAAAVVPSGESVASFVPFALSPDASTWDEVRAGAEGDGWSAAARGARATDFVVFVVPVASLGDSFVVADKEATGALTRFASGPVDGASLARRAAISDPALLDVEILVPGSVPLSAVSLIGVPNDRTRDIVRDLLADAPGTSPRVAVYPPWFKPSEA